MMQVDTFVGGLQKSSGSKNCTDTVDLQHEFARNFVNDLRRIARIMIFFKKATDETPKLHPYPHVNIQFIS